MNKGQRRRLQKERGKLLSSGHYWEWLQSLEKTGYREFLPKEWKEVWSMLARRAVRLPASLNEFFKNIQRISRYPELMEIKFLLLLKDFIEKDISADAFSQIKGLPFPAEEIRKKVITWNDRLFEEKRFRELLTTFVSQPDKVTKEHFSKLAALTEKTLLYSPIQRLSEFVGEKGVSIRNLSVIDSLLNQLSEELPSPLQQLLFCPYLYYINNYLQDIVEHGDYMRLAEIVSDIPFIFPLITGKKTEKALAKLAEINLETMDDTFLSRKVLEATLEEKVTLIANMRHLIKDEYLEEKYLPYLRTLYQGLLRDIVKKKPSLSERERRELPKIMGRILQNDIHFLYRTTNELTDILSLISKSGCLDTRLALLSLISAEMNRDKNLKQEAESVLKGVSNITKEDIRWLFEKSPAPIYPYVSTLKPLIELYGKEEAITKEIHAHLFSLIQKSLFRSSAIKESQRLLPSFLTRDELYELKEEFSVLREEFLLLKGYPQFLLLSEYLSCFPDNFFTGEGYYKYLNLVYSKKGIIGIIDIYEDISRVSMETKDVGFPPFSSVSHIVDSQHMICNSVLKEHISDLNTVKLEELQRIYNIINSMEKVNSDLLIRFNNVLNYRYNKGEKEVEVLKDAVYNMLRQLNKKDKKRKKKR